MLAMTAQDRPRPKPLEAAEAEFRPLAESILQLVWMARAEGHLYRHNRRWYDDAGTPETMRAVGWHPLHHPDHLERAAAEFERSLLNHLHADPHRRRRS